MCLSHLLLLRLSFSLFSSAADGTGVAVPDLWLLEFADLDREPERDRDRDLGDFDLDLDLGVGWEGNFD